VKPVGRAEAARRSTRCKRQGSGPGRFFRGAHAAKLSGALEPYRNQIVVIAHKKWRGAMTPDEKRRLTRIGDGFVLGLLIYCIISALLLIF
jgi:hypothetical protein